MWWLCSNNQGDGPVVIEHVNTLFIVWTNLCFSLFISLYKQLVFDHTLMWKGLVGHSCRAIGSKIL
jgi:hypothetical protein